MTQDTSVGSGLRAVSHYIVTRFPPQTMGVAVVLTYCCMSFSTDRLTRRPPGTAFDVLGLAVFLACFLLIRLVDDIDDLDHDGVSATRRRPLLIAAALCGVLIIGAGAARGIVETFAILFVAFAVLTPWWIKHRLHVGRARLAVCYELVPLLAMATAEAWSTYYDSARFWGAVVVLPCVFAACYEYWKLSRRFDRDDYPIYDLSPAALLTVLVALWLGIAAGSAYIGHVAGFGAGFAAYVAAVTCGALLVIIHIGLARIRSRPATELATRWLLGVPFVVLLDIGFVLAACSVL